MIERAKADQTSWVSAEDAFKLHDTFGFPYEMTKELLAEEGLAVDDQGFEELMERAREVSRRGKSSSRATADAGGGAAVHVEHDDVIRFARDAGFRTRFVGYETTEADTVLRVAERANGWLLAKLEESPFYAEGGGQVSDSGLVETPSGRARVVDVYRVGDDQALALEPVEGELGPGETARAVVERDRRLATMRNHTATHLLHAALRERLGSHVRQAGSYVGPDKLRFDFTHGERLSPEDLAEVERLVDGWLASQPPRARDRDHPRRGRAARRDGAVRREVRRRVRMVEIEGVSRELCGGTHVRSTGRDRPLSRDHRDLQRVERAPHRGGDRAGGGAHVPGAHPDAARDRDPAEGAGARGGARGRPAVGAREGAGEEAEAGGPPTSAVWRSPTRRSGVCIVAEVKTASTRTLLRELSDQARQKLGDAAVVLGSALDGRVHLVANVSPTRCGTRCKGG